MALENSKPSQLTDWRHWAKSLLAAAISSSANSISVMIVDPTNFNFDQGASKLLKVAIVSGIVGIALYLKQSPLPQEKE